ncbi:predicted protein [Nematostella vectensis]|uniref:Ig-like domain-containing protein n=1 Tax=Nematostella vectensis TaxID=45351 RepID=A7RTV8_NEMVE|nr:predicted protein [Nematostella vectensis]|eukprot:XP_001637216.1 predicted protein [Nematostella vectensis]
MANTIEFLVMFISSCSGLGSFHTFTYRERVFAGKPYQVLTGVDWLGCIQACHGDCTSYNFYLKEGVCELLVAQTECDGGRGGMRFQAQAVSQKLRAAPREMKIASNILPISSVLTSPTETSFTAGVINTVETAVPITATAITATTLSATIPELSPTPETSTKAKAETSTSSKKIASSISPISSVLTSPTETSFTAGVINTVETALPITATAITATTLSATIPELSPTPETSTKAKAETSTSSKKIASSISPISSVLTSPTETSFTAGVINTVETALPITATAITATTLSATIPELSPTPETSTKAKAETSTSSSFSTSPLATSHTSTYEPSTPSTSEQFETTRPTTASLQSSALLTQSPAPHVTATPLQQIVCPLTDIINITCSTNTSRVARFTWHKFDRALVEKTNTTSLIIRSPGYEDAGTYRCVVSDGMTEGSADANVTILQVGAPGCDSKYPQSCKAYKNLGLSLGNRVYIISPDNSTVINVYCDMTTDGDDTSIISTNCMKWDSDNNRWKGKNDDALVKDIIHMKDDSGVKHKLGMIKGNFYCDTDKIPDNFNNASWALYYR